MYKNYKYTVNSKMHGRLPWEFIENQNQCISYQNIFSFLFLSLSLFYSWIYLPRSDDGSLCWVISLLQWGPRCSEMCSLFHDSINKPEFMCVFLEFERWWCMLVKCTGFRVRWPGFNLLSRLCVVTMDIFLKLLSFSLPTWKTEL